MHSCAMPAPAPTTLPTYLVSRLDTSIHIILESVQMYWLAWGSLNEDKWISEGKKLFLRHLNDEI